MKRSTRVKSWHENLIEFGERQTKRDVPILDSIWACGGVPVDERQDGVFSKGGGLYNREGLYHQHQACHFLNAFLHSSTITLPDLRLLINTNASSFASSCSFKVNPFVLIIFSLFGSEFVAMMSPILE